MVKIYRSVLRQAASLDPQDTMASKKKRRPAPTHTHTPIDEIRQSIKNLTSCSKAKVDTCKAEL